MKRLGKVSVRIKVARHGYTMDASGAVTFAADDEAEFDREMERLVRDTRALVFPSSKEESQ